MKSSKLIVTLVIPVLLIASCATKNTNLASKGMIKSSSSDTLKIEGNWIKDKGKKFDLSVSITNIANKEILIKRVDMICKKGDHLGYYDRIRNEHTNIQSNNPQYLVFEPGEMKRFHFTCYLDVKYKDKDFYFIVKKVFENNSKDIDTPAKGSLLAKDIEMHIKL
ncbi:MAG: hypothetical protein NTY22_02190 [Proteobacteria bacterium]|nr:hypothetical protein [Pseudomonadota bacterium]